MNYIRILNKSLLWTFLIVSWIGHIRAQQSEWISNDFPNSRFMGIFERGGRYFGAVSNGASYGYNPNALYQIVFYEVEFDQPGGTGFTLNKINTIKYPGNYATIELDYITETNLWIIAQSTYLTGDKQRYRVLLCDEDFDILAEQSIDTTGYPTPFYIDSYNNETYILGSILEPTNKLFFLQYAHENPFILPPIEVKQSDPRPMTAVTSMKIDKRTGDMLTFYYSGIAELDTNLHQKIKLNIDDIETAYHGSVIGVNSNYFSHGLTDQDLGNGYKYGVFQKYDSLFTILVSDTLGIRGQDHYPFTTTSLDFRNNEFLMGGHLDGPFAHINFNKSIKKFYLSKYDVDMHQLWYKEYGGDRAYNLMGLKLLEDGGSLAYGYVTDTLSGLWYAYIMHVDNNGNILTSTTIPKDPKANILIVNPGDETLRILNPDHLLAHIEVYDIQGCHVLTGDINGSVSEIDTQFLPVGLYPYELIQEGRVVGSGKWVKAK